ncbi:MAG: uL13 family ribosomal protein [Pseudomonadota bacterium]
MKTYSAKPADIEKKWVVIDAEGVVLGRLASIIAMRLRGKHKTTFTPHMDMGDNVIVTNADKVQLLGLKGIPGIYFQSVVGAKNWVEGIEKEGEEQRDINRMRWNVEELESALSDPSNDQAWIHNVYVSMLRIRNEHPAFDPNAPQEIIKTSSQVFAYKRTPVTSLRTLLCVYNFTEEEQIVSKEVILEALGEHEKYRNILTQKEVSGDLTLEPYQYFWVQPVL